MTEEELDAAWERLASVIEFDHESDWYLLLIKDNLRDAFQVLYHHYREFDE